MEPERIDADPAAGPLNRLDRRAVKGAEGRVLGVGEVAAAGAGAIRAAVREAGGEEFGALAEFIRELIVQGTNEGLAAARARGRVGGRPTVVNDKLLRAARDMLPNPENSIETIAALLGVSVGTLYNHIPDLKRLRVSRVPTQLDGGAR
ncbi:hypothetical protein ACFRQM_22585 [Streptomyces sp. NPDC056831]|uniref:hypothetical protein n=1 Tax=Streptomyces sp. NPDC056831 TaxID=3345954 RepID=UPI0036AE39C3